MSLLEELARASCHVMMAPPAKSVASLGHCCGAGSGQTGRFTVGSDVHADHEGRGTNISDVRTDANRMPRTRKTVRMLRRMLAEGGGQGLRVYPFRRQIVSESKMTGSFRPTGSSEVKAEGHRLPSL